MRRRLAPTRTAAQRAIAEGRVRVADVPEPKPATLVAATTPLHLTAPGAEFVSRAGYKLAGALDATGIAVAGRTALDVGASTGGFTDCLLQRGAAAVTAVDVGYGQLDWGLRNDPRVVVVERTNIRHADLASLGAPFGLVVADLSFISLVTVGRALRAAGDESTDYLLLVKPQFEVGPEAVGRGGIVRDPGLHHAALRRVAAGLEEHGLGVVAVCASSPAGVKGNREFFVHLRHGLRRVTDERLAEVAGS